LCGYAIGNFYKETSKIYDVCQQHSHVLGVDVIPGDAARHLRA